jgi:hypothetical protein
MNKLAPLFFLLFLATACAQSEIPSGYCVAGDPECTDPDAGVFECFECDGFEVCDESTAYACEMDPESRWQVTIWVVGVTGIVHADEAPFVGSDDERPDISVRLPLASGVAYGGGVLFDLPGVDPYAEPPGVSPLSGPGSLYATATDLEGASWEISEFDRIAGGGMTREPLGSCVLGELPAPGTRKRTECGGITISWSVSEYLGL